MFTEEFALVYYYIRKTRNDTCSGLKFGKNKLDLSENMI